MDYNPSNKYPYIILIKKQYIISWTKGELLFIQNSEKNHHLTNATVRTAVFKNHQWMLKVVGESIIKENLFLVSNISPQCIY